MLSNNEHMFRKSFVFFNADPDQKRCISQYLDLKLVFPHVGNFERHDIF